MKFISLNALERMANRFFNKIKDVFATKAELDSGLDTKSDKTHKHDYLPLKGGNITGTVTFDNNVDLKWKTGAALTNSETSAAIASGTALNILDYNSSHNLHIGAGIHDNKIATGTTYVTGGADLSLRTVGDGDIYLKPKNTSIMTIKSGEVTSAVTFKPTTVATRNLGTASNPWATTYSKYFYLYGTDALNYGSFRTTTQGTTDTPGETRLYIGNNLATGTAGNAKGRIVLYGTNTGYTWISPGYNSTGTISVELPSASGKIPLMNPDSDGYWGLLPPTGSPDAWIRSSEKGFIPYEKGNDSSSLGSSSWAWKNIYGTYVYSVDANGKIYVQLKVQTTGTADTQGVGRLVAGNNLNAGTAGNAKGQVLLYGTNTGYTTITPGYNDTSSITLTLPSGGGTLARTADNVASATTLKTARTLKIGGTGKTFDGSENITWTLNEIMGGQGLSDSSPCSTLYFNNTATSHQGRISCYSNSDGTAEYVNVSILPKGESSPNNYLNIYDTYTTTPHEFRCSENIRVNGKRFSITASAPSSPATGDIWIDI